jgi:hypothetical protein
MARVTFAQIIADIQRTPGLEAMTLGEIVDAVSGAATDIGNQPWPWNYAESNVLVPAPVSTGTVSINDGTAVVTGALTTWGTSPGAGDPSIGWRIRFGNSNLDYIISNVVNNTTINLVQAVNLGQNLAGSSYTLYKDTYAYPTDYIPGSDVALLQPTIRNRIPKIPRYKFEMAMNAGLRSMSTNIQMFYCDQGQTTTGTGVKRFSFRLGPPPAGPAELRLCYHSMATAVNLANATTQTTDLPEGYDEIIGLMAMSKLYDIHKKPGSSDQVKAIAFGKMRLLQRQVATQTIDDLPDPAYEVPDSSISQWGMMIGRTI